MVALQQNCVGNDIGDPRTHWPSILWANFVAAFWIPRVLRARVVSGTLRGPTALGYCVHDSKIRSCLYVRQAMIETSDRPRRTQADRRAQSRNALLEAAARGISRFGYANLSLEWVAREAGYTRGALYHQFANKEDLALAVVGWVEKTWNAEVGRLLASDTDPVATLLAVARGHAVYCRRDVGRVMLTLRVEFTGQDHPVGRAITGAVAPLITKVAALVEAGRQYGSIPPGPPARDIAEAIFVAMEAVVIALAGHAPHDAELAERAVRGLLDVPPQALAVDAEDEA